MRREVIDICNFWFEKGVDGFRCDVITIISKTEGLPDGKWNIALVGDEHFVIGPHLHEYLNQVNREAWSKYNTMIVGEAFGTKFEQSESLIAEERNELDTMFNFEHMEADMLFQFFPVKLNLRKFKEIMSRWQALPEGCWNSLYLENHDQPRSIPRFVRNPAYRYEGSTMLAVMLQMQRGTPYIYQGEEIGMTNAHFKRDEFIDIMATRIIELFRKYLFPLSFLATYAMNGRARDQARMPMQWNDSAYAGFSTVKPWMKVNPNYTEINAEKDRSEPESIFNFYRNLMQFRKGNAIIRDGSYREYDHKNKKLYVYERALNDKKYLVICNFSDKLVKFRVPQELDAFSCSKLAISNYDQTEQTLSDDNLRPYEARVYLLEK